MEDIKRAKERLEARRQMVVDVGHVCILLLPPLATLAVMKELEIHLDLLQKGYVPSELANELFRMTEDRPNVYDIMIEEIRHACSKNLRTYIDREYVFDLAVEIDNYAMHEDAPDLPAWFRLYVESQLATLEARFEIAERTLAESQG